MLIKILDDPAVKNSIAISLGAIVGSLSRYFLTLWFTQRFGVNFPYGTFFINLTGTLGIGFCSGLFLHHVSLPPQLGLFIFVGFLGSYTTFSTFALDTVQLVKNGQEYTALLYWGGSGILGLMGVQLGTWLTRS